MKTREIAAEVGSSKERIHHDGDIHTGLQSSPCTMGPETTGFRDKNTKEENVCPTFERYDKAGKACLRKLSRH